MKHEQSALAGAGTPLWIKSSHSGASNGDCVEFARNLPGLIPVRDSKNPAGATLALSPESWRGFVSALATGHFRV
ncbi:DUF397 domain-containing protein [Streptomyces bohaiensis]|uniref:DUF397 domain-containing protein n=1 Tax=Streptomyces bohaiensis TaxID=1431344 RepID=UPI003B7EF7CC